MHNYWVTINVHNYYASKGHHRTPAGLPAVCLRGNRSVDDAVRMGLHFNLQHLDSPGTYVKILFVDFSSAFNSIIPGILRDKLPQVKVPASTCQWIYNFLTYRRSQVRLESIVSNICTVSTSLPGKCSSVFFSKLFFFLSTNNCTSDDSSVKRLSVKFADDTTILSLIQDGEEAAPRHKVDHVFVWCDQNHLELNLLQTVDMTMDLRRNPLSRSSTEQCQCSVETFEFQGTTIS